MHNDDNRWQTIFIEYFLYVYGNRQAVDGHAGENTKTKHHHLRRIEISLQSKMLWILALLLLGKNFENSVSITLATLTVLRPNRQFFTRKSHHWAAGRPKHRAKFNAYSLSRHSKLRRQHPRRRRQARCLLINIVFRLVQGYYCY